MRLLQRSSPNIRQRPLVRMWRFYPAALSSYIHMLWDEHRSRNNCRHALEVRYARQHKWRHFYASKVKGSTHGCPWFNVLPLMNAHRSYLINQNWIYYSRFGWDVDLDGPHEWWPLDEELSYVVSPA